jgi:hypothetical protein
MWHDYLNAAAFVLTTARAVNVTQSHHDFLNVVVSGAQGKTQAPLYVTAQGIRQRKILCLNIDLHNYLQSFSLLTVDGQSRPF